MILRASWTPLGIDPDAQYEGRTVMLDNLDRLTLYTDGVLEATKEQGKHSFPVVADSVWVIDQ